MSVFDTPVPSNQEILKTISRRRALQGSLATIGLSALFPSVTTAWGAAPASMNDRLTGDLTPIHDPCIIKCGDTYYVYCTTMDQKQQEQIPVHTSKDLLAWKYIGNAFPALPDWALKKIPNTPGIWAPDLSFVNGKYYLYYAVSSFGSIQSVIGLATNKTLDPTSSDYHWEDHGPVYELLANDSYNCIDPTHVIDGKGQQWLAFGSFWTGLKIIKLDPKTGKPKPGDRHVIGIAARPTPEGGLDTIEANYIFERNGWYYLFASYDYCCKGANSTYYTAYGHSKSITGPYVDKKGRSMMDGYGEVILKADQEEKGRWRGPGHCAILRDPGQDYIIYHAYDKENHGAPNLRIAPLVWSKDGWATAIM